MSLIKLNADNFEAEVLRSDRPVLVDFWAVWCGPCKMLSPLVEEVSEENPNVKFCSVNVDEAPDLAEAYGIKAIPTLLIFDGGEEINRSVGYIEKEDIEDLIAL